MIKIKALIGLKIKELRQKESLSQEKLAELANIDRTYIHDIEKGPRNISVFVLEKLCSALKIKLSDFFNQIESNEKTH